VVGKSIRKIHAKPWGAKGLTGLKREREMQETNGRRLTHDDKYSDPPKVFTYRVLRYQSPASSRTQQKASRGSPQVQIG
jgi:hypothetical protein